MGGLFLSALGVFYIAVGTLMVVVVDFARKKIVDKMLKADPRKVGAVPLVVGILLLLSARASTLPILIAILAILGILKGALMLFGPQGKIKSMIDWWGKAGNNVYRIWGIVAILLGIIILRSTI